MGFLSHDTIGILGRSSLCYAVSPPDSLPSHLLLRHHYPLSPKAMAIKNGPERVMCLSWGPLLQNWKLDGIWVSTIEYMFQFIWFKSRKPNLRYLLLFPSDKCVHEIKYSLPQKAIMYHAELSFLWRAFYYLPQETLFLSQRVPLWARAHVYGITKHHWCDSQGLQII